MLVASLIAPRILVALAVLAILFLLTFCGGCRHWSDPVRIGWDDKRSPPVVALFVPRGRANAKERMASAAGGARNPHLEPRDFLQLARDLEHTRAGFARGILGF